MCVVCNVVVCALCGYVHCVGVWCVSLFVVVCVLLCVFVCVVGACRTHSQHHGIHVQIDVHVGGTLFAL